MQEFIKSSSWMVVLLFAIATPFVAIFMLSGYILFAVVSILAKVIIWPWKIVLGIPLSILGGGRH